MLADFALVQVCMIMALGIPVVFLLSRGDSVAATARLEEALPTSFASRSCSRSSSC
jgi:hypothetical protein